MRRLALCGALAALIAAPALAQAPVSQPAKNASSVTFNMAGQSDATGAFHPRQVTEGLLGGAPQAWTMDGNGYGGVNVMSLPTTAPTAAGQALIAANQVGTANQATAQVTVGTTATLVVVARAARRTETLINTSTTPMYCGTSAGVTVTNGWYFAGGVGASRTWSYAGAVYCIVASGSAVVSEDELY
ncbi:MAG: hypothetical protein ACYDD1_04675 [Caulobacteraceae bacterium]